MSSRQANSLEVEIVNGTSSSTLRFFHRTGLFSSQRKELKTLTPPSGDNTAVSSFVFPFEKDTNEFIEVEYKVEMDNQVEVENEKGSVHRRPGVNRGTYKPVGVRIDSTILRDHRRISVVDSEAAPTSAAASFRKKFELRTEPRAVLTEAGWLVTFVTLIMTYAFSGLKCVFSGFRNLIAFTQPPVAPAPPAAAPVPPAATPEPPAAAPESPSAAPEPPVGGTDAGWVQRVPAAVSSAINYVSNLKI